MGTGLVGSHLAVETGWVGSLVLAQQQRQDGLDLQYSPSSGDRMGWISSTHLAVETGWGGSLVLTQQWRQDGFDLQYSPSSGDRIGWISSTHLAVVTEWVRSLVYLLSSGDRMGWISFSCQNQDRNIKNLKRTNYVM